MDDKKNYLIFVNEMGPNYLGNYMYEFIFGPSTLDVDGEDWEYEGKAEPPHQEYINKVGLLENSKVNFTVIQKQDSFTMYDAQEGVIALAWETYDNLEDNLKPEKRMVFNYGDSEDLVVEKLYTRDMTMKFKNI